MLTMLGSSSSPYSYSKVFAGYEVPQDNARFPELEPFRDKARDCWRSRADCRKHFELVKVFNCYKSVDRDRQIGDRRGRKSIIEPTSGTRPLFCDLEVNLNSQQAHVSISDRTDFYHQSWVEKHVLSQTL